MTKDEALKLALEALKAHADIGINSDKAIAALEEVLAQPEQEPTYTSTQATTCAGCGEHKHTPLRIDAMGGYVCLTCIDKKLGTLLGEFGYSKPAQEPVAHIPLKALEQIKPPMLILNNVPIYGYGAEGTVAVYTTPPQRTWVGLTDEDIGQWIEEEHDVLRWAEAKLKEKNT